MSFLAKLHIDGTEFNVLDFNIKFRQETDRSNKPVGNAKGGIIKITIEADQCTDFLSWMLSEDHTKDGKIIFYRRDMMSKMKDLKFDRAFCIAYNEQFTSTTDVPMKISMELSSKEIVFGDAKFFNNWISVL